MNDTYTELQRRLTVAEERNRANIERRNELILKMKKMNIKILTSKLQIGDDVKKRVESKLSTLL